MRITDIVEEDFVNYKVPSMFIGTISCGGKCCTEENLPLSVCQNDAWRTRATITMDDKEIIERYLSNPITRAIVFGGLEPFEQTDEVIEFVKCLREEYNCHDDVVIYTGYYPIEDEAMRACDFLTAYDNIVIKWGRYRQNSDPVFDEVLGVTLASDNQFGERIS